MPSVACLGHWYVSTPIYLGPVFLIYGWIKLTAWRERRSAETPQRA